MTENVLREISHNIQPTEGNYLSFTIINLHLFTQTTAEISIYYWVGMFSFPAK